MPDAYAIIVGAGKGKRFGENVPKLLQNLAGETIIGRAIKAAAQSCVKSILVVAPPGFVEDFYEIAIKAAPEKLLSVIPGGDERTDSVRSGLVALADVCKPDDIVLIHDGARPLVQPGLFDACFQKALEAGAAIAAIPVIDTIKQVSHTIVTATLDRSSLWAAQTPQAFRFDIIFSALSKKANYTDDAAAVEAIGKVVNIVLGSRMNIKITTKEDITIGEAILAGKIHGI